MGSEAAMRCRVGCAHRGGAWWTAVAAAMVLATACGEDAALDRTIATVETIRGDVTLGERSVERLARGAAEQSIAVGDRGLARLTLDSGPLVLVDAGGRVALADEGTLRLEGGRFYAETEAGDELFLEAGETTLRASDAALSVTLGEAPVAYVVRGEVSWRVGDRRGVARAGEELALTGEELAARPVTLWHDWTGGLARPGPGDADGPAGVGVLEARVPDEVGLARWPLVIRRLDVQVRVVGDLAVTEVEQEFFNPASETVEGTYRIRVPEGSVLQRFAVDRQGHLVDGYVREKAQARQAYEVQVYRGSTLDPALLEWVAPGRYEARIYPIYPGESRRIVVRYAEWLQRTDAEGPRLYRFPMGAGRRAPRIQELSIGVDLGQAEATRVRAGMGAAIEEGRVRLRRSDFAPRSDFWLELEGGVASLRAWRAAHQPPPRAPDAREVVGEADERDYWYLPVRLPDALFAGAAREGMDVVVVADVSAATDRSHLELGRSVTEAIAAHLDEDDRVAVVTSDLTIRPVAGDAALGPADPARVEAMLDGLARTAAGGATDLGAAIGAAAALLDPERPGAVVYVGDGAPTVGELEADGLLERLGRLPAPLRLYAVGIGGDANLDLLEAITRGGGLALRVEERSAAADAALAILAHAGRPVAQRVTVELGNGIENAYPRRPVDVVRGAVLPVVGRVRDAPPEAITVRGTVAGEPFEETIAITTLDTEESTDLRLRWASERLRQLLLDGAGREEVAELGTRYGLITPFTSYYVPSAQELGQLGAAALPWIDRPLLFAELEAERDERMQSVLAVALGPLGIAGCADRDAEPPAVAEEEAPQWLEDSEEGGSGRRWRDEEGAMGEESSAATNNRFAIEGPQDDADPHMAREAAREQAANVGAIGVLGAQQQGQMQPGAAAPPAPPAEPAPRRRGEVINGWDGAGGGGGDYGPTGGSGSGYGRGGGGTASAAVEADTAIDMLPEAEPEEPSRPMRRLLGEGGDFFVDEPRSAAQPDRADRGERRLARRSRPTSETRAFDATGARDANEDADDPLAGLEGLGDVTVRTVTVRLPAHDASAHARSRCSDAADQSLDDRRALWTERLGQQSSPSGWVTVYRQALRACEAPTWRDRRALLALVLGRAGTVERMVDVYRLFDSGSARGFLRGAILRRVRSPQDLRAVRAAFGLGREPDWELVEQVLSRASGDEAKVRALRRLTMQYPESFDLKLRLLEALETGGMAAEARRLADRLRIDPRSDAGVRTAVGEMFLRLDMEEEARRVFSEIVEFAPLDELARRRLGDLYRAHGWFEDAYRQYETLASIRPDDPTALLLMAQAAAGAGRIDEALRLEQRLMETAQPGAERGIARIAQLWTSVRLAKLRDAARADGDDDKLAALERRMRRSGVLTGAGDVRVTLVWPHPDAQIALYAAHPDGTLARPAEIAPEHGIEAFDVPEQEDGTYRFEVRRADPDAPTDVTAELVVVVREGRHDEVVRVVPLTFSGGRAAYAWTLTGDTLTDE